MYKIVVTIKMASDTIRRFDNSGLFSKKFENSILCLSYDITQKNIYGRGIDNELFSKVSLGILEATRKMREETNNEVGICKEEATVRLSNGLYVPVNSGLYSGTNQHRLNVGLELQRDFDLTWTVQDFLNHSKRFIERVGVKVSDELTHELPIGASRNIHHYLNNYLGAA